MKKNRPALTRFLCSFFCSFFCSFTMSFALSLMAQAQEDISLVASNPNKAMFMINGKGPKSITVGSKIAGDTTLISADSQSATIETKGKRQILRLGQAIMPASANASSNTLTLVESGGGHFKTSVQINGGSKFETLVDTGATYLTISSAMAKNLGLDYTKGRRGSSNTANGIVNIYVMTVDSINVGGITVYQVEVAVQDAPLPIGLLGMSFLKRVGMTREGDKMVLTKK